MRHIRLTFLLTIWVFVSIFGTGNAQTLTLDGQEYHYSDTLPRDSQIVVGQLDNGLSYYVRENAQPTNRAELALVVNVGSLVEDDDQQGIAHFLEHMLFNGTESFEGLEIDNILSQAGLEIGPDLNAYTSFEETVYTIQIPLDDPELVDTSFQILFEWASKASLRPQDIDEEREIIIEEERAALQSMDGRLYSALDPLFYGDTRYLERLPIGKTDIIRTAPREAFTRYYETWYRPELMAVVAVGNFDSAEIEQKIQSNFASLENPENAPPLPEFAKPNNDKTQYLTFEDPEVSFYATDISYILAANPLKTPQDIRSYIVDLLFVDMLYKRLEEKAREAESAFLYTTTEQYSYIRGIDELWISIETEEGNLEAGFSELTAELKRLVDFGFEPGELERAKENLFATFEDRTAASDDLESAEWRDLLVEEYLSGYVATSFATDLELMEHFLPSIGLEELADKAQLFSQEENRVVVALVPEDDSVAAPSQANLENWLAAGLAQEVAAYEDEVIEAELLTNIPSAVDIVQESYVPELDTTVLRLANGIQVILKPTDFVTGEILVNGMGYGAASVVDPEDYPEAFIASQMVMESGVADFNRNQLDRILTGKNLEINVDIGNLTKDISAYSNREDVETLFQLIYLFATQPRIDEAAAQRVLSGWVSYTENRTIAPNEVLSDAITQSVYGDSIYFNAFSLEQLDSFDVDRAYELYQARFADMDDFSFAIVGDFDLDQMKALAQTYLGNLPTLPGQDSWTNFYPSFTNEAVQTNVYKGIEEQAIVNLQWDGPFFNPVQEERFTLFILESILDIEMFNTIREELAGTYSPYVFRDYVMVPSRRYTLGVEYSADPKRVNDLIPPTLEIIEDLKLNGPNPETLLKSKEQLKSSLEEALQSNSYWEFALNFYYFTNTNEDPSSLLDYATVIDAIGPEQVQNMAQRFLVPERFTQVVLFPEAYKP